MKRISTIIILTCFLTVTFSGFNVSAATPNGYGADLSYDIASETTKNGTLSSQNIRKVFNNTPEGKVMTQNWSGVESSPTVANDTSGWTNGSAAFTYSGGESAGTMSYYVTEEANRTVDGTYGLKFDLSNAGDRTGIVFYTATKSSIGTITGTSRDIYISFWIKALNRDGTTSYSSYNQSTTTTSSYTKAPVSVALCNNHSMFAVLTENNCVEKETSDGWRKLSYIIPAAKTTDLRVKLFVRQSISNEYAVVDRQTLYIDDLYIAEMPSGLLFDDEIRTKFSPFESPSLCDFALKGVDANGGEAEIGYSNDKLDISIESGDASINDSDNIIFKGDSSEGGDVILKFSFLGKTKSLTLRFENNILIGPITRNDDNTYSMLVTNNDSDDITICLIIAVYNGRKLIDITTTDKMTISAGLQMMLTSPKIRAESGNTIKAFIRDSLFGFGVLEKASVLSGS